MTKKEQLFEHFGSARQLAIALEIDATAVYQWKKIPVRRCYEIETITEGKFKAIDLMKLNLKPSTTKCTDKSRRVTSNVRKTG